MSAISRSPCAEVIALDGTAAGPPSRVRRWRVGGRSLAGVVALEQPVDAEGCLPRAGGVAEDDGEEVVRASGPAVVRRCARRPSPSGRCCRSRAISPNPSPGPSVASSRPSPTTSTSPGLDDVVAVADVALLEDRRARGHLDGLEAAGELLDRRAAAACAASGPAGAADVLVVDAHRAVERAQPPPRRGGQHRADQARRPPARCAAPQASDGPRRRRAPRPRSRRRPGSPARRRRGRAPRRGHPAEQREARDVDERVAHADEGQEDQGRQVHGERGRRARAGAPRG